MKHRMIYALGAIVVAPCCLPGLAMAYDSHDFTTTASTAGTTAYIVGKHNDDDFAAAHEFAHSQRVALQREAAQGGGAHIESLAELLGRDRAGFGSWMQTHYTSLYPTSPTQANLVDRIVALQAS